LFKFGGGRTLRPGDSVETAEERIVREEKTKKLLIAYKESLGLNIDPKLKLECEKVLQIHFCSYNFSEGRPDAEVNFEVILQNNLIYRIILLSMRMLQAIS